MRSRIRRWLVLAPLLAAFLVVGVTLGQETVAQDEPPKAAAQGKAQETPPRPPAQQPPRVIGGQTQASRYVDDVAAMRSGQTVDVVRSGERFELDLRAVDLDADPLLIADGEPITQAELRRTLCLLVGSNEIDQYTTFLLGRRIQKERGIEAPPVSDEEVERAFEQQKLLAKQMGGIDPVQWEQQIREQFGWDRYLEFQKIQLGFEKLFMPEPPPGFMEAQSAKFAEVKPTWEAEYAEWKSKNDELRRAATAEGRDPKEVEIPAPVVPVPEADLSWMPEICFELLDEDFGNVLKENYARGQPLHPMLRRGLMNTLKFALIEKTKIVFRGESEEPMAAGTLFTVEGEAVATEAIYSLIQARLDDATRRLALRELLGLRAADKALASQGAQVSPAQAAESYAEMAKEYEGSLIPLAQAIMLRGFPNEHHYKRYFRRKAAFRDLVQRSADEDTLRDHFDKAGRLFYEHGSVQGQVLFVPGETLEESEAAMKAALDRVNDGEDFVLVARELGKFPSNNDSRHGEFNGLVRNRLRQFLKESEYTSFVQGYCLSDEIFYTGVVGDVFGPIYREYTPGMKGAVAVKVHSYRTTGSRRKFEEARVSVLEDIADLTFPGFVNEAMGTLHIELPN